MRAWHVVTTDEAEGRDTPLVQIMEWLAPQAAPAISRSFMAAIRVGLSWLLLSPCPSCPFFPYPKE